VHQEDQADMEMFYEMNEALPPSKTAADVAEENKAAEEKKLEEEERAREMDP